MITTHAYQTFIQHNQIQGVIDNKTRNLNIRNYDELAAASREIVELVRNGEIPRDLKQAILEEYKSVCEEVGNENLKVSVRSSTVHEDVMASFAGQYETALNVASGELLAQRN